MAKKVKVTARMIAWMGIYNVVTGALLAAVGLIYFWDARMLAILMALVGFGTMTLGYEIVSHAMEVMSGKRPAWSLTRLFKVKSTLSQGESST